MPISKTTDIKPGTRVVHSSVLVSYGPGEVLHIHPAMLASRPPAFAQVRFDRDGKLCPQGRRVYLADLQRDTAPRARIVYPPERAGEPVGPAVA